MSPDDDDDDADFEAELAARDTRIAKLEAELAAKIARVLGLETELAAKNTRLVELESAMLALRKQIEVLLQQLGRNSNNNHDPTLTTSPFVLPATASKLYDCLGHRVFLLFRNRV